MKNGMNTRHIIMNGRRPVQVNEIMNRGRKLARWSHVWYHTHNNSKIQQKQAYNEFTKWEQSEGHNS